LSLVFSLLESLDTEHDRGSSAPLGDDEGLSRRANLFESRSGILAQVGDRDDLWELRHDPTSYGTSERVTERPFTQSPVVPLRLPRV
jgi:hypothetical protein